MKKFLLLATVCLSVLSVKAQDGDGAVEQQYPSDVKAAETYRVATEKQATPGTSALRTTWIANKPGSNWFFSLEGGMAYLGSENFEDIDLMDNLKPTAGVSLGKWFSPVWGLRLNATGAKLSGYSGAGGTWFIGSNYPGLDGKSSPSTYVVGNDKASQDFIKNRFLDEKYKNGYRYDFTYVGTSMDFLLNLKNFFTGYNPKAFFNPVLYVGMGWAHTLKDGDRTAVNNLFGKGGLQFNFRLGDRWELYLAGEGLLMPEMFDRQVGGPRPVDAVANGKLGLTYRFNFRHFIKAPLYDQSLIDALNAEINELRNRPQPVCPPVKNCPEPQVIKEKEYITTPSSIELTPVFFKINSSVIGDDQMVSIARAAQYLLDNPNSKIEIQAYADKNTGHAKSNLKLSENRANAVAKMLTGKFGIEKSRIKTSFFGDSIQPFAENDKNRVVIFVK